MLFPPCTMLRVMNLTSAGDREPALADDLFERVSSGGRLTAVDAHRIDTTAFHKAAERAAGEVRTALGVR